MEWRDLKHHLHNALTSLPVSEIYCIDRYHNIVSLVIVLENTVHLKSMRKLTQLRVIDALVEKHAPEVHKQYLFTYEVWDRATWGYQEVNGVLQRNKL